MKYTIKAVIPFLILHSSFFIASAQVAINTDNSTPDASAILDVKSINKGMLIPRMTGAQRAVISNPATGLLVYQMDSPQGIYEYNGTKWILLGGNLTNGQLIGPAPSNWTMVKDASQELAVDQPASLATTQWQSFTAENTGLLQQVDIGFVPFSDIMVAGPTISIYVGEGTSGTLLYSQSYASTPNGFQSFTINSPVSITRGSKYTIAVQDNTAEWNLYSEDNFTGDIYTGGRSSFHPLDDFRFRTFVLPTTVSLTSINQNTVELVNGAIHIDEQGNVGVGTTTKPDDKLDVEGDIRINDNDIYLKGGTDQNHGLGWYGPSKLFDNVNLEGPALYGFNGGALGTVRNGNQKIALSWDFNGDTRINDNDIYLKGSTDQNHGLGWYGPGKLFDNVNLEGPALYGFNGGALGTVRNGTDTIALVWNSNGQVGIGKTSPQNKLDVAGNIRINNNDIYLRSATNISNGLGYYGQSVNKLFANDNLNGPVLYGFAGGALGTNQEGTEKITLFWKADGSVGIGTTIPKNKLDVAGGIAIGSAYSGTNTSPLNGAIIEGRVGIGTNNPTKGKLEVVGTGNTMTVTNFGFLNNVDPTKIATGNFNYAYSIYADDKIAALEFNAFSDARIKNILGQSNSQQDLATLMAIEITDYQHIDTIQKGNKMHKKVIAQQVAEIFPQAVTKGTTEVIPDIYQRAKLNDGWIYLATDLQVGDRVKIITESSNDIHEVVTVEKGRFRVETLHCDVSTTDCNVFVYGREVNDFHTVDYEAIAMLNVSATQAQQERIAALEQEVARLQELEKQLDEIKAMLSESTTVSMRE